MHQWQIVEPTRLIPKTFANRGFNFATKRRYNKHLVFLNSQIQGSHSTETIGERRDQRKDSGDGRVKANKVLCLLRQHKKRPDGFQDVVRNIIFEFFSKEKKILYCLTFALQFRFVTI